MTAKLDENGIEIQSLAEIKDELINGYEYNEEFRNGYKQLYGPGIQIDDDTNVGKQISIYAEREQLLQEQIEGNYYAHYRATSGGASLDRNLETNELQRLDSQPSTVVVYAAGTPSQVVSAEALKMSVDGTGDIFLNTAEFTLGSLVDESVDSVIRVGSTVTVTISGGHSFPLASWIFIEGAEQEQYNDLHQITAAAATTFEYELTGTLPVTPATGTIIAREATPFNARSDQDGAIQALSGAITTIAVTVPGVDRVENAVDAIPGREVETDPEAKIRAIETLAVQGGSTTAAIRSKLLTVPGVTFATVFQNVTDFVDANGLPAHSIRCLVTGGADADIWNILFIEAVSAGIKMDGTEQTTIVDQSGDPQPVAFSRATPVRIYIDAGNGLVTNSDPAEGKIFPANGNDLIKIALTGIVFENGWNVTPSLIKGAIDSVDGVVESDPEFDTVTPPVNKDTIDIAADQIANIDSGDITGL